MSGQGEVFPRVQGRCPTCGTNSLFLGAGGYVTCSWSRCSDPCSASDVLGVDFAPEKAAPTTGATP